MRCRPGVDPRCEPVVMKKPVKGDQSLKAPAKTR